MSPTNLGNLPSNLPLPNQRVQVKRATGYKGIDVNSGTPAGTKLTDYEGNPLQISYTPRYPCLWLVRGNVASHGVSGGWLRCDWGIYITPADVDGITLGHQCPMNCYDNTVVEWRTFAAACMFRLAAGITYNAYLAQVYSQGGSQQYLSYAGYMRIIGVVLGEGEI